MERFSSVVEPGRFQQPNSLHRPYRGDALDEVPDLLNGEVPFTNL